MEFKRSSRSITRAVSDYFRDIDFPLFAAVLGLVLISVVDMYGIGGLGSQFFGRQAALVVVGIMVMVLFSFSNYRYLKNYSFPVLLLYFTVIMLLLVTLGSHAIRGSRAWIILGDFTFEPSELMKLMMIVLMAKYFSQRHIHINQFRHILISGLYFLIPAGIILLQPDLGSAIILGIVWGGMLLAAGINRRHMFFLLIVAVVTAYLGWVFALQPYQRDRLLSFVNPYRDPKGSGYNIIQSQIAIGSGHWFGAGLGRGSQATLGFLPESYNDFAFAAFTEQFGFVGVLVLLGLILVVIARIVRIGERSGNNFTKLFAVGMAILISTHVFISSGVNLGFLPITGIPFSFLSYGGSHLLVLMIGIGTLQSMKRYG